MTHLPFLEVDEQLIHEERLDCQYYYFSSIDTFNVISPCVNLILADPWKRFERGVRVRGKEISLFHNASVKQTFCQRLTHHTASDEADCKVTLAFLSDNCSVFPLGIEVLFEKHSLCAWLKGVGSECGARWHARSSVRQRIPVCLTITGYEVGDWE